MNKQLITQHRTWVLETIDLIRTRKARPDIERISRMLHRSYGLTTNETKETLETLVSEGRINMVHFKGNVSYRKCRFQAQEQSPEPVIQSTSNRLMHALKTITKATGDGVQFYELQDWLLAKNPDTRLVKHRLYIALKREIDADRITQLSDNCYVLTESLPKTDKNKHLKPIQSMAIKTKVKAEPNLTVPQPSSSKLVVHTKEGTDDEQKASYDVDPPKRGRPLSKRKVMYTYVLAWCRVLPVTAIISNIRQKTMQYLNNCCAKT